MKKFIYLSALLALTACSNDELVRSGTDPSEIRFDVTANPTSRQDLHSSSSKDIDFNVWALTTLPDDNTVVYLDNEHVTATKSGSVYEYNFDTGNKYWPAEGYLLDFYALHFKYAADSGNALNGGLKFDLTSDDIEPTAELKISENADNQDDVLYAVALDKERDADATTDGNTVQLNFRHALSQLQFQFDNIAKNLYIEVNKVTVKNIDDSNNPALKTSGIMTLSDETTDNYPDDETHYDNIVTCDWSDATSTGYADKTADVYLDYGVDNSNNDKYLAIYPKTVDDTFTTSATYNSDLSTINPAILVIPQKCDKAVEEEVDTSTATGVVKGVKRTGLWLVLHCRVYNTVGNDWMCSDKSDTHFKLVTDVKDGIRRKGVPVFCGKDDSGNPNDTFADLYVPMPMLTQDATTCEWKPGKKYVYKLVFGTGNATAEDSTGNKVILPIAFEDVTIDEWGEHTNSLDNIDI